MSVFTRDSNESYTELASAIDREMYAALAPIFERYAAQGVSLRELAYVANQAVVDLHLSMLISRPTKAG